jgi:alpha-tubulin suppressor-like RCC1 family protein
LGDGTTTDATAPVTVIGVNNAVSLSAGGGHTCAVTGNGGVQCWGSNSDGQLGDGNGGTTFFEPQAFSLVPVTVSGLSDAEAVFTGNEHSCAVTRSGRVQCWGENSYGQLGDASRVDALTPVAVSGLNDVVAVSAAATHTCALTADGRVQCWGENQYGQLGDGTTTDAMTPVSVSGLSDVVAVAAGYSNPSTDRAAHTCAVKKDGSVWCWGTLYAPTPVMIVGLTNAVSVSAGGNPGGQSGVHTCVVTRAGGVWCWGENDHGQLGAASAQDEMSPWTVTHLTPVTVTGLSDAVSVSAGGTHSCALRNGGRVQCWGASSSDGRGGQADGDGSTTNALKPVTVSGLSGAVAISALDNQSCALISGGHVRCWGQDITEQFGDGSKKDTLTPVTVIGPSGALPVSSGGHSCALTSDGGVQCWGSNRFGQLGDGSTTGSMTPVTVSGLSDAVAVSAGDYHTCALTSSGRVQCWGANSNGQLGDGTGALARLTPVTVSGLSGVVAVSAGNAHSCALYHDGAVSCWGSNYYGQAGWPVWKYSLASVVLEP